MSSFFNVFKSFFLSKNISDKEIQLYDPLVKAQYDEMKLKKEQEKEQAYSIITNTFEEIINKSLTQNVNFQKYIKITNFIKSDKGTIYYKIPTDAFVRFVVWSQEQIKFDKNNVILFQNMIQFIINSDVNRFFSNNLDFERTCTFDLDYRQDYYKKQFTTIISSSSYNNGKDMIFTNNPSDEKDNKFLKSFSSKLINMFSTNCQVVFGSLSLFNNYFAEIDGVKTRVKATGHATILLATKMGNKIYLYWYDSVGYSPTRPTDVFLEEFTNSLNTVTGKETFVYVKSMYKKYDNNIQALTSQYDIGMCQLFSLFWIHNVMMIMYNLRKQNNIYGYNISLWIDNIDEFLVGYVKTKLGISDESFEQKKQEVYAGVYMILVNFFVNVTNTMLEQKIGFYDEETLKTKLTPSKYIEFANIEGLYNSKQNKSDETIIEEFAKIFKSSDIKTLNITKKTLSSTCNNLNECRSFMESFSTDEKRTFLINYYKNSFKYFSLSQFLETYLDTMINNKESSLDLIPSEEQRGSSINIYKRYTKEKYSDEEKDMNIQAWKHRIDLVSSSVDDLTKKRISDIEKFAKTDITVSDIKSEYELEAQMIYDLQDKLNELREMYTLLLGDLPEDLRRQVEDFFVKQDGEKYYNQVINNVNRFKKIYFKFPKSSDTVEDRLINISKYFIVKYLAEEYQNKNIPYEKDIVFPKSFASRIRNQIVKNIIEISDSEAKYFANRILTDTSINRKKLVEELKQSYHLPNELLFKINNKINLKECFEQFNQIYINNKESRIESAKESARNIFNLAKSKALLSLYDFETLYNSAKLNYNNYYEIIKSIFDNTKNRIKKLLFESCEVDEDCFSQYCAQDPLIKSDKYCARKGDKLKRKSVYADIDTSNILQTKRTRK
jgi:hypothetical protein